MTPTPSKPPATEGCAETGSVTMYRLVLSHPDWPRETRTKWQKSSDFRLALARAMSIGVTARIESQNTQPHIGSADVAADGEGREGRL